MGLVYCYLRDYIAFIMHWCIKLIVMLGIKLGVNLEVKLGVGSKTGGTNSVFAFLKCMDRSVLAFLKCTDGSVLVFLKCMDGSVLAHLRFFHPICPHLISTVGEFRCTIAIMQEKHQHVLFEIECSFSTRSVPPGRDMTRAASPSLQTAASYLGTAGQSKAFKGKFQAK